jgi:hypothetical protein
MFDSGQGQLRLLKAFEKFLLQSPHCALESNPQATGIEVHIGI